MLQCSANVWVKHKAKMYVKYWCQVTLGAKVNHHFLRKVGWGRHKVWVRKSRRLLNLLPPLLLFNKFHPPHTFGSFWKWCKASNSAIFKGKSWGKQSCCEIFSAPYLPASAWFAKCCSMTRLPILWLANQQVTITALLSNLPGGLTSGAMWQPKWYQHWPTSEALCRLHLHAVNTWYLVMWFCWCFYTYSIL